MNSIKPGHYTSDNFTCFDVMIETQGMDAVTDFCICIAIKYLYRWKNKNGVEDIEKAYTYLEKFLEIENKGKNRR